MQSKSMKLKLSLVAFFIACCVAAWFFIPTLGHAATSDESRELKEQTVQLRRIADALEVLAGKRNK